MIEDADAERLAHVAARADREEVIAALVNERFGAPPLKCLRVKHRVKPNDKLDADVTSGNTADQEGGGIEPTATEN